MPMDQVPAPTAAQESDGPAQQVVTELSQVRLCSVTWGPIGDDSRPLAVLLHGFPDTAHTWRHLGPTLAGAGYRVLAPFTRGYAPSGLAGDGVYHPAALMADALALHTAHGGDERAVLIGHDWGAITANGIAAMPEQPFGSVVSLAVPPLTSLTPRPRDLIGLAPRQLALSWYTVFNQLPRLPEQQAERLIAHLWRRWSPGYDPTDDLALVAVSLPAGPHRSAAFGYYRDTVRRRRLPEAYAAAERAWLGAPRGRLLHLHGEQDGCCDVRWARRAAPVLAALDDADAQVRVIADGGHFLHLEQPEAVATEILEFLDAAPSGEEER